MSRSRARLALCSLTLLAPALSGCSLLSAGDGPTPEGGQLCTVSKVVDGDTLWADCGTGTTDKVRLIGLDTPETRDPRKGVQCWGPEASARARALLTGQRITLTQDSTQAERDKYGRRLVYVWLPDGRLYQDVMISEGQGREYTYNRPYAAQHRLKQAQKQAQKARTGLWGAC